jgi:glycine/D-amino acid oxidase-like deaminating enzyme
MFASDQLREAEIVVVGAGAVGAAIAYRLAQAGAHVTVVERLFPGAGTSGNSFAWLNGHNKRPKQYHRLNVMSIRDHLDLADELAGKWVEVRGGLHWTYDDDRSKFGSLKEIVARLRSWGARVDQTTPEVAMRELEPDLWIDPEHVSDVYVIAQEGHLDGVAMAHGAIHAAVRQYGASVQHGEVVGVLRSGDAVTGVRLADGGELRADVVINAAGPAAGRIAAMAEVDLPLNRQPGLLVCTEPAPTCLKRIVHAPEMQYRPFGAGRLLLHDDEMDASAIEGEPISLDDRVVEYSMSKARKVMPGLAQVRAESVRVGVRPMPRDGHPIVGFEPQAPGLYTCVMHSGITLAARMGLLVTEDLITGDVPELAPYRQSRFAEAPTGLVGATIE